MVGGGFAGGYVARLLGRRGATIVSPENFMLYTPMLPEAASGTLEPRHTVVPLRQMCPHAELLLGRVTAIDEERRSPRWRRRTRARSTSPTSSSCSPSAPSRARSRSPASPSTRSASRTSPTRSSLRNRILRELEAADAQVEGGAATRHLGFVFVGAGYAGVEALAELADLVTDALRWYPRLRGARQRWVLVDAAPKILSEIPTRLGDYAAKELARRGVEIHVGTTLESYDGREAVLSNGERIPRARSSGRPASRRARSSTSSGCRSTSAAASASTSFLRVEGRERVWALGDCAAVPNEATPGQFDPPTCQHALRQARRLAKNLQGDLAPYRYRMLGQVATLGRYKGIADVMGVRLRGFPGWFVTRSYHLLQLPLFSRKLRVVVDWTTSLFFRRDIAELSGLGDPHRLDDAPAAGRRRAPLPS